MLRTSQQSRVSKLLVKLTCATRTVNGVINLENPRNAVENI